MTPKEIQQKVYNWVTERLAYFNAGYGVSENVHPNRNNSGKHLTVTFGSRRTLDAEVAIYGNRFIIFRSNRHGTIKFTGFDSLMEFLNKEFKDAE